MVVAVNAEMSLLYWRVGHRINTEVLQGKWAGYGKDVINSLSLVLSQKYGNGWGTRHLRHCLNFAEAFQHEQIDYTVCRQFTWSHIRLLIYMNDPLKREFYIEICKLEHWRVRLW